MNKLAFFVLKRIPGRHLISLHLAIVVLFGACSPSIAAKSLPSSSIDFPAIDAYLEAQMRKHDLPGMALAVIEGEEIVYLQGYGTTGEGQAMTPQTQLYIGSQSKSFTTLAISQLAEAGLVDLDAPVKTYIPWFEVADPQASQQITIRHLLHHTRGLSEAGFSKALSDSASLEACVRSLKDARMTAPLGKQFQYFNYGYDVLGYIIEQVSKQSYTSYIQANILAPLQMRNTTADPLHAPGLSTGFTRIFGLNVPLKEPPVQPDIPAGYIVSTVEDMAHYAIAMSHQGKYQGASLLSGQGMRALFKPQLAGYAMGWFIGSSYGTTHISHGGANRTFHTYMDLYPNRDRGFVLIVNQGSQADHFISANQLFLGLDALVLGHAPPPVDQGMNVRWIGWGLLVLVLALIALHTRNFYQLRTWPARARNMNTIRLIWDVVFSFLLPAIIMTVVVTQVKAFYGYRFNLMVQMQQVFRMIPEIGLLILIGTVPDIVQGLIKLYWVVGGKIRPDHQPHNQSMEPVEG